VQAGFVLQQAALNQMEQRQASVTEAQLADVISSMESALTFARGLQSAAREQA